MHCTYAVAVAHVRIVSSSIEHRRFYMLWTMWLCVLYHPAPKITPFFLVIWHCTSIGHTQVWTIPTFRSDSSSDTKNIASWTYTSPIYVLTVNEYACRNSNSLFSVKEKPNSHAMACHAKAQCWCLEIWTTPAIHTCRALFDTRQAILSWCIHKVPS